LYGALTGHFFVLHVHLPALVLQQLSLNFKVLNLMLHSIFCLVNGQLQAIDHKLLLNIVFLVKKRRSLAIEVMNIRIFLGDDSFLQAVQDLVLL